jgi:dihydrofolate reductase
VDGGLRRDRQAADKIVYSRTLKSVSTTRTQLERDFDSEAVRQLKVSTKQDILIGGAALAAHAIRARLVDEGQLFLVPIVLGSGKRCIPDNVRLALELVAERRICNGKVHLRYRISP